MREAINLIWRLSLLGQLVVGVRLLAIGLGGEYPALTTACCFLPIKSLLLMLSYLPSVPPNQMRLTAQYLSPLEWILCAWIVYELFSRWSESYAGIGRFGRLLFTVILVSSVLISVATWRVEWEKLIFAHNFRIYYIQERIVWGTLAFFVMGTWLFFRNYPVTIAPNVLRHTYVSLVYFTGTALCLLAFTLTGLTYVAPINLTKMIIGAGSFIAWAILLTRKGEIKPKIERVSPQDKIRIEKINQDLLTFMGNFPKTGPPKGPGKTTRKVVGSVLGSGSGATEADRRRSWQ